MKNAHIPQPQNVRSIQGSFAWIDHRLLRHGYLPIMTHEDQGLYLFLILAADRHGVSFYRKERICDALSLTFQQFDVARDRLIDLNLIAYQGYSILSPNGYYQVLPIRTPAPKPSQEVWRKVAEQGVHT
jgi:replication initiation and membrane attachment protein DnaB